MLRRIWVLWSLIFWLSIIMPAVCWGGDSDKPQVLFFFDNSKSMDDNLPGTQTKDVPLNEQRITIIRNAVFAILDDNGDGKIDSADEASLGVKFGYMKVCGYSEGEDFCADPNDDSCLKWDSGDTKVVKEIGTPYSEIWTALNTQPLKTGSPIANGLIKAKRYLDTLPAGCGGKFVIFLSDAMDGKSCRHDGDDGEGHQRRIKLAKAAKALGDAGYKVFVLGFGPGFEPEYQNMQNWVAYYGKTDNPDEANTGSTGALTIPQFPCSQTDNDNDPGDNNLHGYSYFADDATKLNQFLKKIIDAIKTGDSSLTSSPVSVPAGRTSDEDFLYAASFKTGKDEPFWTGFLKRYSIADDGTIGSMDWDAGSLLKVKDSSARNMFTFIAGSRDRFNYNDGTSTFTPSGQGKKYLDVQTGNDVEPLVGYIRGESKYNPDNWKLGDPFHSFPIVIGRPNPYFNDVRSPAGFKNFRDAVNAANRDRIVVLGANDGQFHAFQASDGNEKWSFIPPNLLPKLKYIAHSSHPTSLQHTYFVDGPVTVADVWWGNDDTHKTSLEWKTLLVFGEGRGVRGAHSDSPAYLWSSSPYCDENFTSAYQGSSKYYCGYYAFNMTDTSQPPANLLWRINLTDEAKQGPYLGEPWSKMAIGKVLINGKEKWVGFIGGGYNSEGSDLNRGRGLFVVDLSNGNILWSYTKGASNTSTTSTVMTYSIPASPAIVDTDNDGFVDTAYGGDWGGNIWRFKFCTQANGSSCNQSNWSGGRSFNSSGFVRPIYVTPSVTKDTGGSLWVFWGTGDRENPSTTSDSGGFFAFKDDRISTYTVGNLEDISGKIFGGTASGWYIAFSGGEKVLSDPAAFGGMVLFTTYTPAANGDPCNIQAGTSRLYALAILTLVIDGVKYDPGKGVLSPSGDRSVLLGAGMAGAPVLSQKPSSTGGPTDLYVSLNPGGNQDPTIISAASAANINSTPLYNRLRDTAPRSELIHWRDMRIQ